MPTTTPLSTRARLDGPQIGEALFDVWGNRWLDLLSGAAARNYLQLLATAPASSPGLTSQGTDTNLDLTLTPKGTGAVKVVGPLVVTTSAQIGTTLDVTGATHLHSTLLVDGLGTFGAGLVVTGNVIASGLGKFMDVVVGGYGATPTNATISTSSARLLLTDASDVLIPVATGSLVASNSLVDTAPTNGLFVKGASTLTGNVTAIADVSLTLGKLKFTGGSQSIVASTTLLVLRNAADSQNNVIFADAGDVTIRRSLLVSGTGLIATDLAIATGAGGLGVAGNTLLHGTLVVDGATTLSSTLHGVGLATFDSGVTLSAGNLVFGGTSQVITASTTQLFINNHANTQNNLVIADAGDFTMYHKLTVLGTGLATTAFAITTSAGGITSAGDIAGATKLTITGASTLTGGVDSGLTINSGQLTITAGDLVFNGTSKSIIQPVTSLLFRDHANANTNMTITDAGACTHRAGLTVTTGGILVSAGGLSVTGGLTVVTGGATVSAGDFAVSAGKVTASGIGTFRDMKIGGNTVSPTAAGRISVVGSSHVFITDDSDVLANLHNNSQVVSNSGADNAPTNGLFTLGGIWLKGDPGGLAASIGLSATTALPSAGGSRALTAQTAGGPASTITSIWIKVYVGTTVGYIPWFQ